MRRHPTTTFSYLWRHYFDDEKLRDYAITEFVRAMRTGRLVAFTGSLTTKMFGYVDWETLFEKALELAEGQLRAAHLEVPVETKYRNLIDTLRQVARRDKGFDGRVAFSTVAQMLDHISHRGELSARVTQLIANLFLESMVEHGFDGRTTSIRALFQDLGVSRVVTTNYDLELEAQAIGVARNGSKGKRRLIGGPVRDLFDERSSVSQGQGAGQYSLDAELPNGHRVVSDLLQRDRPEALIEFAVGCPEIDTHIFHLHGRADVPDQMILSYRDYDRLYRRGGLGKAPFEHALRILFAGNPVLFVGLGMTEPELNETLAEFVGNHPYQRKAPAFLIWNKPDSWKKLDPGQHDGHFYSGKDHYPRISSDDRKAAFRLDKLHRLGILTIFADDKLTDDKTLRPAGNSVEDLRRSIVSLSRRVVSEQDLRLAEIPRTRWRNSLKRIERGLRLKAKRDERIIHTWTVNWEAMARVPGAGTASNEPDISDKHFISVLIRPAGAGKTARANEIARSWVRAHPSDRVLIINFNMRIDTDSILSLIADLFRYRPDRPLLDNLIQDSSREQQFRAEDCLGLQSGERLLLVLKGLERIFDVNGHSLSAEFDEFMRIMIERQDKLDDKLRFAVLGTERIRGYFEGWLAWYEAAAGPKAMTGAPKISFEDLSPQQSAQPKSPYLTNLAAKFRINRLDAARQKNKALVDYAAQRRHVFKSILTVEALRKAKVTDPTLALDVISIMSLIGQPIETAVLFHAPRIRDRLKLDRPGPKDSARARLDKAMRQLARVGLIGEVNPGPRKRPHEQRYAVHISVQSEIRDRYAIPLSDSILSTAYNMSLYSAQPADAALPEAELHDELGQLVDWLIGAYKDEPYDPAAKRGDRGQPHVVAAFRAAFSLIRGLYSMSALLSVDRGDRLVSRERDGLLTEHAQRLERMLAAFDAIWRKRNTLKRPVGADPLYPDELVWLHNERGVVKLAQGDLYEARFSFGEADRINSAHVEFHDQSHNWRRITLNQIVVDIDRAKLQSADDRMNAIERRLGREKAAHIRKEYLEANSPRRIRFDPLVSKEDILAMALITGYRGLVSHLRGELDAAKSYFDRAIRALQRMDEQRALALFRRHKASLHSDLGEIEALHRECRLAISGSESVQQLDIVYASRLMNASYPTLKGEGAGDIRVLRTALEALEYATLADMHRLYVEAQAHLARVKLLTGDYEAALEHASEAMATATRYGMTLYKIVFRTLMGDLLVRRGNTESGRTLIRSAISGAVRAGYQRAIEAARRTLAESSG